MNPEHQRIIELFGLVPPSVETESEAEEHESVGRDSDESVDLGDQSLREGDFRGAVEHYQRALRQSDGHEAAPLIGMGSAYECMEDAPSALRQYLKAHELEQDNPEPYLGMSDIYMRQGKTWEAIQQLERAVELDPKNPFYHLKLAETLRQMHLPTRALRAIRQAVLCAPDQSFYHYWMGDLQIEMRLYEEALLSLRASIELSPGDDHLYAKAGVAFWGAGKRVEAIKAIRLASDLDPDKNVYYGILQRFLIENGQPVEAQAEAARAAKMDAYDRELLDRMLREANFEPTAN